MASDALLEKPFDQYQRYRATAEIIGLIKTKMGRKPLRILDVGGYFKDNQGRDTLPLKTFLPEEDVLVLDRAGCRLTPYIRGDAVRMPVRAQSFDIVTCLDVLEHIPPKDRPSLLKNLINSAKNFVILAAPFRETNNELAEQILFEFIQRTLKGKHKELEEHIRNGLPEADEIRTSLKAKKALFCDFPSGYLTNWLLAMMARHFLLSLPETDRLIVDLDKFYNSSFYESDQRPPAYRRFFVIAKSRKDAPLLQDIVQKFEGYREKFKHFTLEKADFSPFQVLLSLEGLRDRNRVDELNRSIEQLNRVLKDQDIHLQNYRDEVHEKKIHILRLEQEIKDQQVHLQNFKQEIRDKEAVIKNQDQNLKSLKKEVYDKDVHIRNIENNMNLILRSKVWRTADFFRRIFYMRLLKIFPPVQKALLTITREGFVSFWQKVKKREMMRARDPYDIWLEQHALTAEDIQHIKEEIERFPLKPKISILMPVYNVEKRWLRRAVQSVLDQVYANWELCIVDDASTNKEVKEALGGYEKDDRIRVRYLKKNQGIAEASNAALSMATGEYVGLLDHDDELAPDALYENVKLINDHPEADLIYSDEDKINAQGKRIEPFFKPDWSPDLLLSFNYICHFLVLRRKILGDIGRFRKGFEGSQDYDLLLRATEKTDKIFHIPKVLYHWRQVSGSTATLHKEKISHINNSMRALQETLERRNIAGTVEKGIHFDRFESYRVRRKIKDPPLVSILIPFKDKVSFLQRNLKSIKEKTEYPNYEILVVDNNSVEPETLRYLQTLRNRENIQVLEFKEPFNFSRINNFAAEQAKGDHIFFLNNDIEVISPGWLSAMMEHSVRDEVGAVGAKLVFSNNTIQHAGIVLGLGGVAGHSHKHFPLESDGYFGALNTIRNYSAVTAACMLIKKRVFEEVGRFDDIHLCVAFNDVDLCMRIREKGYFIVYTPFAVLYHYESTSRGYDLNPDEIMYMKNKWGNTLLADPYYNPNLTLDSEDFRIKIT